MRRQSACSLLGFLLFFVKRLYMLGGKCLLFVSNPVATWLSGWQEQKLMVYRLAKWLNTKNKWTKWSILLSVKFKFYTLLSAKFKASGFHSASGYEYCILSFSICSLSLSGQWRKYRRFYFVPTHNEIPNFLQATTLEENVPYPCMMK